MSLRYIPRSRISELYSKFMCNYSKLCQIVFQGDYHFALLPATYNDSSLSISLSTLGIICLFDKRH